VRYDSRASVAELLAHPPFALAPTFPESDGDWHEVHLAVEVPAAVRAVELGLSVIGNGSARLRSLSLEVVDATS
jgi:hypothetical protein